MHNKLPRFVFGREKNPLTWFSGGIIPEECGEKFVEKSAPRGKQFMFYNV